MKTVKYSIGDLGVIFDGPHATPQRRKIGDKYFLNISALDNGRLNFNKCDFVDKLDFEKWTRRVQPKKGDLLFSYETRLGDAALMVDDVEASLGRRMALIRPNTDVVNPRFLLYKWLSPDFRREIDRRAIRGATVDRIPLSSLGDWPIDLPDIPVQVSIGNILGVLDDKIAANQRVIGVSDALLRSWWSMKVAKRGRPIPLSSLARFVNGKAFTKGATGEGRVVVRIAELNSGITGSTVRNELEVDPDNEVNRGDFLMAWSGSLTTARWYREQAVVNQHIFKVIPKGDNPMWAVACAVEQQMEYFKRIAADKATTMGHIQRRHLDEDTLWVADLTPQEEHYGRSLWKRALVAEVENEQLARTRDELLPLLMDGRITVKDAERVVEEV